MKQDIYKVKENYEIANSTYKMILNGDTSAISAPGQFINIMLEGHYLRRPISICDFDENSITIIYKIVGKGTEDMSYITPNTKLNILNGLGNGFNICAKDIGKQPLIVGGGVGIPPLYNLCKKLIEKNLNPIVVLGYNSIKDIFYENEFKSLGCQVYITTADGSYETKGFVTDIMKEIKYSYFFSCGPLAMFKAINKIATTDGQLSFEERMGCGFGACMGCTCKTSNGYKRICKEGPVMLLSEVKDILK